MYTQTAYPVINLEETGRCIERHRCQAGLTVRDLQNYFGFEYPQAIYNWQHGKCLPSVDNLLALARLLKVSMEDLLVYEDQGVPFFAWMYADQSTALMTVAAAGAILFLQIHAAMDSKEEESHEPFCPKRKAEPQGPQRAGQPAEEILDRASGNQSDREQKALQPQKEIPGPPV